ncbi:hypothetical protein EVG20_g8110 [Dentipellis fragilis]|uniref:SHSP domain-containing protein n=1 Tax=Dentipellis fragilis TaxID=205917 RepID=A0A4Y9Y9I0_9AGAM|nr:hypothetical protein EVG20_g8110 [Dentipellis fragilis]
MSLTFYEPCYSLSDFDRLFDEAFNARTPTAGRRQIGQQEQGQVSLRPRMDVHEDKEKNIVTTTFELPGLKKEDVDIEVNNNLLTVSGTAKSDSKRKEEGYTVLQQPDAIKASMDQGVLTVSFPRAAPEAAAKKVAIQ